MNKPTRYYSKQQEKKVAKYVGGKRQPNSGATPFYKGDVITDEFLIECKTKTKDCKSFTVKEDWLLKNEEEAQIRDIMLSQSGCSIYYSSICGRISDGCDKRND